MGYVPGEPSFPASGFLKSFTYGCATRWGASLLEAIAPFAFLDICTWFALWLEDF
ncbi:hypothetical protein [Hydrococcus rivularis]|uniref:hypothetical protein n=1 Tax=Hydrococcus rivularis TaxID=1616834 RepID=UPI000A452D95|nr:hypothetical protein [Hydrococcus rivularis]